MNTVMPTQPSSGLALQKQCVCVLHCLYTYSSIIFTRITLDYNVTHTKFVLPQGDDNNKAKLKTSHGLLPQSLPLESLFIHDVHCEGTSTVTEGH